MVQMRDISRAPAGVDEPRLTRPRRDAPFEPASDAKPLLLAHGGVLTSSGSARSPTAHWELQDELAEQRRGRRIGDRLLLVEHFPVYTIGRGGTNRTCWPRPAAAGDRRRISSGSTAAATSPSTARAAGGLSIVELRDPLDLRRYVRSLEEAIIATAAAFDVPAHRLDGLTGVWARGAASWRHRRARTPRRDHPGLALNVNTELRWLPRWSLRDRRQGGPTLAAKWPPGRHGRRRSAPDR